ncbi:urease accessory protein UreD [Synechococcus sp. RSCCF101]|uniref:urease accessory protein UreD n=1 Tax=Synechococcus sp. RSCCF101 TaxID=2511069 RepID=UPI001248F2FB|nr:urease accessory protein UreD [Synechococcus sp. RSCCF101]QEY32635.1 urease accessory protein UreD [Synechococcus sp. RSCCF101]
MARVVVLTASWQHADPGTLHPAGRPRAAVPAPDFCSRPDGAAPDVPAADGWQAAAELRFSRRRAASAPTLHQARCTAPLKVMRARQEPDGRCTLPLLHTAGGLVGGDQLGVDITLEAGSRALITSTAAQKVYGSIGLRLGTPDGRWARQRVRCRLEPGSDLEWLPQELVLYRNSLFEQRLELDLAEGASFLACDVVRLGRTAAGEGLGEGQWRSALEAQRRSESGRRWELVDRLALDAEAAAGLHGLDGQSVVGTLVWLAPQPLSGGDLAGLLERSRRDRGDLVGEMACGALDQGLIARYRGPSCRDARFWFTRLWRGIRAVRGLSEPEVPREWPFQEAPLEPAEADGG